MSTAEDGTDPSEERSRPSLEVIARAAHVSVATASRVLNDRPGIASSTRDRVMDAARHHGYRKRGAPQTAPSQLELVFGSLDGVWTLELIRGAGRVASRQGLSTSVSENGVHHSVQAGWAAAIVRRRPAAVLLVASDVHPDDLRSLRSHGVPFVVVDPAGDPPHDVPSVGSTNWAGGLAATRHLLELGHRRIAVVAGPDDLIATRARVAGFRSAMDEAGLPVDESLVVTRALAEESSAEAGLSVLDRTDRPTAVFATSDVKALGVYAAARSLDLRIPEDVSVVGYDDLQFAGFAGPPLTTVHQPLFEMAQEAAALVLALRNDERRPSTRIELHTSLVVRGSTAAPRG